MQDHVIVARILSLTMSYKSTKTLLRKQILQNRKALSTTQIINASKKISHHFCQSTYFSTYTNFACYMAVNKEIDPQFIMHDVWQAKKQCFLPVLHPKKQNELLFQRYEENDELQKNRYNILEPVYDSNKIIAPQDLHVVLMPLVAFDQNGNRLGMGAGYYDRTFSFHANSHQSPLLVGLGYDFQQLEQVPCDSWDIKLTTVLTETGFLSTT
jgi:5-formyltetrahydrofolate cyclo-ligase